MSDETTTPPQDSEYWETLTGLTSAQKRAYIQSLYAIACVDDDFDESEMAFLFMVAQRMELTPEEFEASLPSESFTVEQIQISPPEDEALAVQWLRNLILMVSADGRLEPTEYQTILYFAEQLGFHQQIVDEVLTLLQQR